MAGVLIDTHVLVWWLGEPALLSAPARDAIEDPSNPIHVSAASAWEIATKFRKRGSPGLRVLAETFEETVAGHGFHPLPVTWSHGRLAGSLDGPHLDPFDRMLAAQAEIEGLALVSADPMIDTLTTRRIW